jgi:hypothetical protein
MFVGDPYLDNKLNMFGPVASLQLDNILLVQFKIHIIFMTISSSLLLSSELTFTISAYNTCIKVYIYKHL